MTSITLSLSGNSSELSAEYFPPLDLSCDYVCGLIDFHTYNSIPNIDVNNNLFHVGDEIVELPVGSYEVDDIADCIAKALEKTSAKVKIRANNNTLRTEIKSSHKIYFNQERSIGSLLGFSRRQLDANMTHMSDLPVNITKVNAIRIECNLIASGSFINNRSAHTLHEFSPDVGPGYKINEVPTNVIYLPVNVRRISSLSIRIVDQDGDLINFRGETITARLHLKPAC